LLGVIKSSPPEFNTSELEELVLKTREGSADAKAKLDQFIKELPKRGLLDPRVITNIHVWSSGKKAFSTDEHGQAAFCFLQELAREAKTNTGARDVLEVLANLLGNQIALEMLSELIIEECCDRVELDINSRIDPETILPKMIGNTRAWVQGMMSIEVNEQPFGDGIRTTDIIDTLIESKHPLLNRGLEALAQLAGLGEGEEVEPMAFRFLARFMARGSEYARKLLNRFDAETLAIIAIMEQSIIGYLIAMYEFFDIEAAGKALTEIKEREKNRTEVFPEQAITSAARSEAYDQLVPKKDADVIEFPKKKK
jgi:hypothetical protein